MHSCSIIFRFNTRQGEPHGSRGGLRDAAPAITVRRMNADRARELLTRERSRIEAGLAALERGGSLEASDQREPGDVGSEDLYQDEYDQGRREDLERELAALERAEARLEEGTYGLSVESGKPIPEGRLEARPTAERTVEEEDRYRREA